MSWEYYFVSLILGLSIVGGLWYFFDKSIKLLTEAINLIRERRRNKKLLEDNKAMY